MHLTWRDKILFTTCMILYILIIIRRVFWNFHRVYHTEATGFICRSNYYINFNIPVVQYNHTMKHILTIHLHCIIEGTLVSIILLKFVLQKHLGPPQSYFCLIGCFTVLCSVPWPLNRREARVNLVLLPSLFFTFNWSFWQACQHENCIICAWKAGRFLTEH